MSLNEKFGRGGGTNVRKVEIQDRPDAQTLQKLLSDLSTAAPGTQCEVSWKIANIVFMLTLSYSKQVARASWKLHSGKSMQLRLIWEYSSNDIYVIERMVKAELEKLPVQSQTSVPSVSQTKLEKTESAPPALLPEVGSPRQSVAGLRAMQQERRAVIINDNLSNKLSQLFINAKENLLSKNKSVPSQSHMVPSVAKPAIEWIDLSPGRQLLEHLFVNDLGIFSYSTFLFFLEREYYEGIENSSPVTLVVFKASTINNTVQASIPANILQAVAKTIKYTQRKTDVLTQSTENEFAILLPDTNTAGGVVFVNRAKKALLKFSSASGNAIKFTFGLASLGEHCKTLPELLDLAQRSLVVAQQNNLDVLSHLDIPALQGSSEQISISKSVDLNPTRQLVSKLISGGIFTYPAFLAFLEHEYNRSYRKKRDLLIMLLKVRVFEETFDETANMLPPSAFYEIIRRVGDLLTKRDIFAHYGHGNFVIMRPNTTAVQMQSFAKKVVQVITGEQWLTPECPASSLRIRAQVCTVQPHENKTNLLGLVLAS